MTLLGEMVRSMCGAGSKRQCRPSGGGGRTTRYQLYERALFCLDFICQRRKELDMAINEIIKGHGKKRWFKAL